MTEGSMLSSLVRTGSSWFEVEVEENPVVGSVRSHHAIRAILKEKLAAQAAADYHVSDQSHWNRVLREG